MRQRVLKTWFSRMVLSMRCTEEQACIMLKSYRASIMLYRVTKQDSYLQKAQWQYEWLIKRGVNVRIEHRTKGR